MVRMLCGEGSKIAVAIMKDCLRLHSQITTSGRKHERACKTNRRTSGAWQRERPTQGALAAAHNIEGDNDLDAGGDDKSEIDA
jgi:hypothetical protein